MRTVLKDCPRVHTAMYFFTSGCFLSFFPAIMYIAMRRDSSIDPGHALLCFFAVNAFLQFRIVLSLSFRFPNVVYWGVPHVTFVLIGFWSLGVSVWPVVVHSLESSFITFLFVSLILVSLSAGASIYLALVQRSVTLFDVVVWTKKDLDNLRASGRLDLGSIRIARDRVYFIRKHLEALLQLTAGSQESARIQKIVTPGSSEHAQADPHGYLNRLENELDQVYTVYENTCANRVC